ncbi:MAG: HD domain-containing protein, partial [Nitrospinae bacterium]|nr:HD domain-containing protein [Nitrospinota bacterium]
VDDEESITKVLERRFSREGYSCEVAADGAKAADQLKLHQFDVMITDVRMPNMDGMKLTEFAHSLDSSISIVVMTAFADLASAMEAIHKGAFDYHPKPVEFEKLAVVIANGVERARLVRERAEYTATLEKKVAERTKELEKKNLQLRKHFLETVTALVAATEVKDKYTEGHSKRVAANARALAGRIGFSPEELEGIYTAGLLHDMGKIGIPDEILLKPGIFSPEEREVMQDHTTFSAGILSNVEMFRDILHFVLYHHERYDGKGYPAGLSGDQIPLGARILSIADLFDAMTSTRPHKARITQDAAIEEMMSVAGTQVDPKLAREFVRLIRENLVVTEG